MPNPPRMQPLHGKKPGRISPEMPIKYVRLRFVYANPKNQDSYPIYGEWMDLNRVIREAMFANKDYRVMYLEFETKEVQNIT